MAHIKDNAKRNLNPAALTLSAFTAACLLSTASPAFAEQAATIKEMGFTTQQVYNQEITVVSTDKKKWDKIASGSYTFGAHINIDTKHPGWVRNVGIVLGACGGVACSGKPLLWFRSPVERDYENQMAVTFPTSKIPVSTTGIATVPFGDQIVAQCNSHLTPSGASAHTFNALMPVTFVADTFKDAFSQNNPYGQGGETPPQWTKQTDHSKTASVVVKVNCEPFELKRDVDSVATAQPKNLNVTSIALFRSTYSHATTQPNPGTVCKKARWLVRLSTNKAGPVKFKLWIKNGDAPMTSKLVDAWASFDGPGKYKAEYSEWTEVSKTSVVQAMAEDKTNPIGQSTGWKKITQHCTGAAGGGLADAPHNANPDNGTLPSTLKVTGELTLADSAPNSDKPRLGQAVFKIWATKPGTTSYKLTCSGGRNWEGTLPTAKVAEHKYQAVGAQNFQVSKTEQIGCALRSTSLPNKDVIAVATKLFVIKSRHPEVGSNDKANPDRKPQTGNASNDRPAKLVAPKHPAKIGVIVSPVFRVACAGGKTRNNTCVCPAHTMQVKTGSSAFRCVKTAEKLKRLPHNAKPAAGRNDRQSALGHRRFVR